MNFQISGGSKENHVVVGNAYDKYSSSNPIVKLMMKGFESALSSFLEITDPKSIHEIGCGEGYWVLEWNKMGLNARGSDFSSHVIQIACANAYRGGFASSLFKSRSIYELNLTEDGADLIVCCEVLEHLEDPHMALQALQKIVGNHLIVSVPREPIWRILNLLRGCYIGQFGNTPGHIQHWSKNDFIKFVSQYFEVVEVKKPLPWTMLLCRPYK